MRNRTGRMLWSAAIFVLLVACQPPGPGIHQSSFALALSDFPETGDTFSVVLQSFDSSGSLLDNVDLGTADAASVINRSVSITPAAVSVGIYLLSTLSGQPVYFAFEWLEDVQGQSIASGFWIDYNAYFYNNYSVVYGLNSNHARMVVDGQAVDFTYSDAPYYVLKATAAQGRTFQVNLENIQASSSVEATSSLSSYYQGNKIQVCKNVNPDSIASWGSTTLYLVVTPADLSAATESRVTVTDISAQAAKWAEQTFGFSRVAMTSDGSTLVFADLANKSIKKWDVATGDVTAVKTFSDPPRALVYDGGLFYVGAGTQLLTYDAASDVTTPRQTFSSEVRGIFPAGDYLLAAAAMDSSWTTLNMIRKADFAVVSQRSWVYGSNSSVFVPSQSRVYLMRDPVTPNDICYQEIDFGAETLGTYGDSPYHGDYPMYSPLLQFGSDLRLLCGSNIFGITDTGSASKIKWLESFGTNFADLLFFPDRILVLASSKLSVKGLNSPYTETSVVLPFTGEVGKKLFRTPSGVLVISTVSQTGRIVVRQFSDADLGIGSAGNQNLAPARRSIRLAPKAVPHAFQK